MVDILSHKLVSKHEILSPKEKSEVLKKFGVTKEQLPEISDSDPVVETIKAKPGDIIRITRNSPTAGKFFYYRTVQAQEV